LLLQTKERMLSYVHAQKDSLGSGMTSESTQ